MSHGKRLDLFDEHSPKHLLKTLIFTFLSPMRSMKSSRKTMETKSIYHQLPSINDENNNQTIIHLPTQISSQKSEFLTESCAFTREHILWIFAVTLIYFLWFICIAGIGLIHVAIYVVILVLYLLSDRTRRFILAFLIYLVYLLFYDALHLLPNYSVSKVHIRDVYLTEKRLFGIFSNGNLMTLNEYFRIHHRPFLDVFTGICYLNW